jgi:hypothetical protein
VSGPNCLSRAIGYNPNVSLSRNFGGLARRVRSRLRDLRLSRPRIDLRNSRVLGVGEHRRARRTAREIDLLVQHPTEIHGLSIRKLARLRARFQQLVGPIQRLCAAALGGNSGLLDLVIGELEVLARKEATAEDFEAFFGRTDKEDLVRLVPCLTKICGIIMPLAEASRSLPWPGAAARFEEISSVAAELLAGFDKACRRHHINLPIPDRTVTDAHRKLAASLFQRSLGPLPFHPPANAIEKAFLAIEKGDLKEFGSHLKALANDDSRHRAEMLESSLAGLDRIEMRALTERVVAMDKRIQKIRAEIIRPLGRAGENLSPELSSAFRIWDEIYHTLEIRPRGRGVNAPTARDPTVWDTRRDIGEFRKGTEESSRPRPIRRRRS